MATRSLTDGESLAIGLLSILAKAQQGRAVLDAVDAAGSLGFREVAELERAAEGGGTAVVHHEAAVQLKVKGLVSITVRDRSNWTVAITPKGQVALAWIHMSEQ